MGRPVPCEVGRKPPDCDTPSRVGCNAFLDPLAANAVQSFGAAEFSFLLQVLRWHGRAPSWLNYLTGFDGSVCLWSSRLVTCRHDPTSRRYNGDFVGLDGWRAQPWD